MITKDNVPAAIDGVLFFLVANPEKAVIDIQDYAFAIAQYAQATLRDVVGGLSLDELLSEREQIQQRIAEVVEQRISNWGLHLDSIRLQDIEMPEDLKRIMSRQASAEREKRATITKAEGDKIAAVNLAAAAAIMEQTPGAMKLRTLQTIDGLGAGPSNTVIMFPIELTETVKRLVESLPKNGDCRAVGRIKFGSGRGGEFGPICFPSSSFAIGLFECRGSDFRITFERRGGIAHGCLVRPWSASALSVARESSP